MNTNPITGVAFGYISADSLDSELVDTLMYGPNSMDWTHLQAHLNLIQEFCQGAGITACCPEIKITYFYEERRAKYKQLCDWIAEFEADLGESDFDAYQELLDRLHTEEPSVEGQQEGVHYLSSWLGGALNFFILSSESIVYARPCSPCVPGAGNLGSLIHGKSAFGTTAALLDAVEKGVVVECYTVPADWMADSD